MRTFEKLLRVLTLAPFGLFCAAACGGSAFEAQGAGGQGTAGVAGSNTAGEAGSVSAAGSGTAGSSVGGSVGIGGGGSGGSGRGGNGGSAGQDQRQCSSNTECEVVPATCCNCGTGPVSNYTAINSKYETQFSNHCEAVDCAPCPPTAFDPNNPVFYYVATCRDHECVVVDLRGAQSDITACKNDNDCTLRAGTGCCPSCDGGQPVAINSTRRDELEGLVCGTEPISCSECSPQFAPLSATCSVGRCSVKLTPCSADAPCGL